jgi:hypothetical protein
MLQHLMRSAAIVSACFVIVTSGCGTSGSDPVQYPEVRFEVRPAGQSTFTVDSLIGGGVSHSSVTNQQFTATGAFDIALENAMPPYEGTFTLVAGDQITVSISVISPTGQTLVSKTTSPGHPVVTVSSGGTVPVPPPGPANPEVRFDVCAPLANETACSVAASVGTFGVLFTGTLGDPFTSHLINGATPTIYFLEAPSDNVAGVFTREPQVGVLLVAQLLFNGVLQQTQANASNVIIKQDL